MKCVADGAGSPRLACLSVGSGYRWQRKLGYLLIGAALSSGQVWAQDQTDKPSVPAAAGTSKPHSSKQLSAVQVSAQIASLKDVGGGALGALSNLNTPFSVTTVAAEKLQDMQPASLYGVFASDASVSRQAGGDFTVWSSYLTIRGLPISSTSGSIKINGQPTNTFGVSLPVEDMEQVQLLKGASGFMYGFAAPGGIVNFVTKKPTDTTTFSFDEGYHSNSIYQEHLDVGGRTQGWFNLGYRLNVSHQEGRTGRDTGVTRDAVSLSLDAHVGRHFIWSFDWLNQDSDLRRPVPMAFVSTYTSLVLPHFDNAMQNPQPDNASDRTRFNYLATDLSWIFNADWRLDLSLGQSDNRQAFSMDYMYLMDSRGRYQDRAYDGYYGYAYRNAELRVSGQFSTFGIEHHLVAGLSRQNNDNRLGYSNLKQGYVPLGYRYLDQPGQLVYSARYGSGQPNYSTGGDSQKAVYISDTIDLLSQLQFLAGVRYTYYTDYANSYSFKSPQNYTRSDSGYGTHALSPTAALLYHPIKGATIYGSYVESLEGGSTVGASYANVGEQLGPIKSKQYELGAKFERRRFDASAAIFRVDRGTGYANAENVYVQNGISRYQGLDLSGAYRISRDLAVNASVIYLDKASYLNASSPWLVGKAVPGAFHFSSTLGLDYHIAPLGGLDLHLGARYTGKTTVYQNLNLQHTLLDPGYTVYDLALKYSQDVGGHLITYRFGINNLTDKSYWVGGSSSYIFMGDRRSFFSNISFEL